MTGIPKRRVSSRLNGSLFVLGGGGGGGGVKDEEEDEELRFRLSRGRLYDGAFLSSDGA